MKKALVGAWRPLSLGIGAVVLALLVSCTHPYFIWVVPGSTASHLTFAHAWKEGGHRSSTTGHLWVETCERIAPDLTRVRSRRLWVADWRIADSLMPNTALQVTYGVQPPGSERTGSAPPLEPGCYSTHALPPGGGGTVYFWVRTDSTVAPFSKLEMDSMWAVHSRHTDAELVADGRAIEGCRAAYRAAGGDAAALHRVDRTMAYDTTRFGALRCEDLASFDTTLVAVGATPLPSSGPPPQSMLGDFVDDYGNRFLIARWEWTQMPHGKFNVTKWVPSAHYLIAQNDSSNSGAPGKWTRIDWVTLEGMPPWEWAFCLSAYEAPTADSAEATRIAKPGTPRTGCNGHPYSRMKRVVREGQAAADSVAKQKCREAYATVGGDGAGLQSVDDMIPYDTTRVIGRSCGWLRRQDPRLRGAE